MIFEKFLKPSFVATLFMCLKNLNKNDDLKLRDLCFVRTHIHFEIRNGT